MTEEIQQGSSPAPPQPEQDMVALIKRMQQQLVFLEKKIDILIAQSSPRPFGEKNFSKHSRPFGRPHRPFDGKHGGPSGGKKFDHGRPFEKRPGEEGRGFDHKKKAYGDPRETGFGRERPFARRDDGPRGGFDHKKKVFRYKRKGHR